MNRKLILASSACLLLVACSATVVRTPVAMPEPVQAQGATAPARKPSASCPECARIERIETLQGLRATQRGGAVLGGVVGGVLAAPAKRDGPAAPRQSQAMYRITLRMGDGRRVVVNQNSLPTGLRVGSPVLLRNWRVVPVR